MNPIHGLILIILGLCLNFRFTEQFLKKLELIKGLKGKETCTNVPFKFQFKLSSSLDEEFEFENYLFKKGLDLWYKINEANKAWTEIKSENMRHDIRHLLDSNLISNLIEKLIQNPKLFVDYPMLPDVIAFRVKDKSLQPADIKVVIEYFLQNKMHRQLACMIALHNPPITFDHFNNPCLDSLICTFEFLFLLNSDSLVSFFKHSNSRRYLMISPLIACYKQEPSKVRQILKIIIDSNEVSNFLLLKNFCFGIIISNYTESDLVYLRNEDLIEYLYEILNPFNDREAMIALKVCSVINLIRSYRFDHQKLLSKIYMDDSIENVNIFFEIYYNFIAHFKSSDYLRKIIDELK